MNYADRLRDPRWQKVRLQKLHASKWACEVCGDTKEELHVHHKHYEAGRDPWEYSNDMLQCLCDTCHQIVHMNQEKVGKHAKRLGLVVHTVRIQDVPMRRWLHTMKHGWEKKMGSEWAHEMHILVYKTQAQIRDVLKNHSIAEGEIKRRTSERVDRLKESEDDAELARRMEEVLPGGSKGASSE